MNARLAAMKSVIAPNAAFAARDLLMSIIDTDIGAASVRSEPNTLGLVNIANTLVLSDASL